MPLHIRHRNASTIKSSIPLDFHCQVNQTRVLEANAAIGENCAGLQRSVSAHLTVFGGEVATFYFFEFGSQKIKVLLHSLEQLFSFTNTAQRLSSSVLCI